MAFNWKLDKKILIVDDDDNFREYLYTMLSEWGYQVVEAGDGIKAMLRIMEESPDLLLMDLDMPTISGRRVTELINSVPQIRNIPIIVISGSAMEFKDRLKTLGAVAVFSKPFDLEELLSTIDATLESSTLKVIEEEPEADEEPDMPAGEEEKDDVFAPFRNGSPQETLEHLHREGEQQPDSLESTGQLKLAQCLIVRNFFTRFDDPSDVLPRLHPQLSDEITRFNLNPTEGFVLSQMDGRTDLGTLFFVSGMSRFSTCLLLENLLRKGIVLLEDGRARSG